MRWQNPPKERRNILSKEIKELINEGLILPPATWKLNEREINESIRDEEELSDNDLCI